RARRAVTRRGGSDGVEGPRRRETRASGRTTIRPGRRPARPAEPRHSCILLVSPGNRVSPPAAHADTSIMRLTPIARSWRHGRNSGLQEDVAMRSAIVMLLFVTLVPRVSLAAETPELSEGVRVRLSAPSVHVSRLTGVLVDVTSDRITIDPD